MDRDAEREGAPPSAVVAVELEPSEWDRPWSCRPRSWKAGGELGRRPRPDSGTLSPDPATPAMDPASPDGRAAVAWVGARDGSGRPWLAWWPCCCAGASRGARGARRPDPAPACGHGLTVHRAPRISTVSVAAGHGNGDSRGGQRLSTAGRASGAVLHARVVEAQVARLCERRFLSLLPDPQAFAARSRPALAPAR